MGTINMRASGIGMLKISTRALLSVSLIGALSLGGCRSAPTLAPGVRQIEAQATPQRPRWLLRPVHPRRGLWRATSSGEGESLDAAFARAERRTVTEIWDVLVAPSLNERYPQHAVRWRNAGIEALLAGLRGDERESLTQERLNWWARGQIGTDEGSRPFLQASLRLTLRGESVRELIEHFVDEQPGAQRAAAAAEAIEEALEATRASLLRGERALMTRNWEPIAGALQEGWRHLERLREARAAYQRETTLDPPRNAEVEIEDQRARRIGQRLERLADQLKVGLSWRQPTSLVRSRGLALFSALGLALTPRWGCEQRLAYLLTIESPRPQSEGRLKLSRCPFGEELVRAPLPWPLNGAAAATEIRRLLSPHLPHLMGRPPPPPAREE